MLKKTHRVNQEIIADPILLIDEENRSLGKTSLDQAKIFAYEKGYDLVEIQPKSSPPVCKLMDYGKYLYQQEKLRQKFKEKKLVVKEIRLSLKIDEHDFLIKVKQAQKFLEKSYKVRVAMKLYGRELTFIPQAIQRLERFRKETGSVFEKEPEKLGNCLYAILRKES